MAKQLAVHTAVLLVVAVMVAATTISPAHGARAPQGSEDNRVTIPMASSPAATPSSSAVELAPRSASAIPFEEAANGPATEGGRAFDYDNKMPVVVRPLWQRLLCMSAAALIVRL
ncbi:hypothetical protein ACP70R_033928 [Stipagrostis hirtigluma subsp. patula]